MACFNSLATNGTFAAPMGGGGGRLFLRLEEAQTPGGIGGDRPAQIRVFNSTEHTIL